MRAAVLSLAAAAWLLVPGSAAAVGAFFLLFLFPYTRLVHVVSYPIRYLARPYQVVIWNRRPSNG